MLQKFYLLIIKHFKAFNASKKSKKRAYLLAVFISASVIGVYLILSSLNKNILYFNSPTDIRDNQDIDFNKKIRVGGMVKTNTLNIQEQEIIFIIKILKMKLK